MVVPLCGAHHVLRLVGERTDAVLGDRQPAVDRQPASAARAARTGCRRATALPSMSVCMSSMPLCGFKLVPPVSKQMPLPTRLDRRRARRRAADTTGARCPHRASRLPRATARKAPAPRRFKSRLAVELVAQAQAPREILQQAPISRGVEGVRRQRGQPAREIVAGGRREGHIEAGQRFARARGRCAPARARGFGLLLKVAKRNAAACERGDDAHAAPHRPPRARIPAATAAAIAARRFQAVRASLPAACSRSKALACGRDAGDQQQRLARARRPAAESSRLPCATLRGVQAAQQRAVRQRRPIGRARASAAATEWRPGSGRASRA